VIAAPSCRGRARGPSPVRGGRQRISDTALIGDHGTLAALRPGLALGTCCIALTSASTGLHLIRHLRRARSPAPSERVGGLAASRAARARRRCARHLREVRQSRRTGPGMRNAVWGATAALLVSPHAHDPPTFARPSDRRHSLPRCHDRGGLRRWPTRTRKPSQPRHGKASGRVLLRRIPDKTDTDSPGLRTEHSDGLLNYLRRQGRPGTRSAEWCQRNDLHTRRVCDIGQPRVNTSEPGSARTRQVGHTTSRARRDLRYLRRQLRLPGEKSLVVSRRRGLPLDGVVRCGRLGISPDVALQCPLTQGRRHSPRGRSRDRSERPRCTGNIVAC
jgi:hypothetical protein